jgi:molybdopterin-containing oxidoreductase family iron-sulfur binding subunit
VDHGFNAYQLRTSDSPWFGYNVKVQKTGEHFTLATTQHHQSMEGRDLVRAGDIEDYVQNPEMFQNTTEEKPPSLYPPVQYTKNKWGMSINVNACIG